MELPRVGFGTFLASDPAKLKAAIHYAVEECGVRHIDCAIAYFNQEVVGEALAEIFAKGVIKRSDLFITSKLWNTHHRPDLVEKDIRLTLQQLKLDYLDLYLMHWPVAFKSSEEYSQAAFSPTTATGAAALEYIDILDTYKAMEECVDKKLTRFIGVSNFSIEQMERLIFKARIKPYANQVEGHLYFQHHALADFCEKHGIYMVCHTCLGRPPQIGPNGITLIAEPELKKIAEEVGKTPGQVALRFLLQINKYTAVIPMSMNPVNIRGNAELDFELSQDQYDRLVKLDCFGTMSDPTVFWKIDVFNYGYNKYLPQ